MIDFIDGMLEPALWLLAEWSLRWGVLIGILAAWLIIVRPRRSATRYLVCFLVLLAGLALPALPHWGKGFAIATPRSSATPKVATDPAEHSAPPIAIGQVSTQDPMEKRADFAPAHEFVLERTREPLGLGRTTILGLAIVWMLGAVLLFARRLGGWLLLERMRRTAVPVSAEASQRFQACVARLALRRKAALASHSAVRSPIALGLHRPMILVPPSWTEVPEPAQRASLLHELAHLARYDDWTALVLKLVRIVFFFHPLLLWLLGRIEYERELLCDETVVGLGIDPRDYAGVLLEFSRQAGRLRPAFVGPSFPLGFGHRRTVKARIHHLLEANMNRWMSPLPVGRAIPLGALVLGLALALGSFGARAIEADDKESSTPGPDAPIARQENNQKTKVAGEVPAKGAKEKKRPLTYGGRTFAEWRAVPTTELKPEVRIEAIKALGTFGVNGYGKEAAEAILEVMRGYDVELWHSDDVSVILEGASAFRKMPLEGIPALEHELKHGRKHGRQFAIFALTQMRSAARPAVSAVIEAFRDEDPYVRRRAIQFVGNFGPNPKELVPAAIVAMKDPQMREDAIVQLSKLGHDANAAVPALIEALKDEVPRFREKAIEALRNIGPKATDVVPALVTALKDKDAKVRNAAIQALGSLGPAAKEAVPALIEASRDSINRGSGIEAEVARALQKINK